MKKILCLITLLAACSLSACSRDYPLVANGYSKTANLSALDAKGLGNFVKPIPPGSCLLAFKSMPDLKTMQIGVDIENEPYITYTSQDLAKALNGQNFKHGVFLVDESGLWFKKKYDCDEEIR